jgi:type II secretory pathway predicted ATPase ExeA
LSDGGSDDPGCLTYERHFGLREKPFSLSPNPRFFFRQSSHAKAFDALIAGIRRREGILALIGEVGTGKTTLCRAVLESLDRKTFAAFVPDPILSREDLLKTLLVDFGVVSVDEIKSGFLRGASRTDLSYTLYEFLSSLQPLKAFAVVMIDEAQNLPTALLEEIRILSDMEQGEKLLQLVLIGQPELQARLGEPELRQVRQRLSIRCKLDAFGEADVKSYVSHRLGIAGNSEVAFDEDALPVICAATEGIPRLINLVCDRALLRAASVGATTVTADHIIAAADDLCLPLTPVATPPMEALPATLSPSAPARLDAASRSRPRQGLPPTYQMRHDAHYVEELVAHSLTVPSEKPLDAAVSQPTIAQHETVAKHLAMLVAVATIVLVLSGAGIWLLQSRTGQPSTPAVSALAPETSISPIRALPMAVPTTDAAPPPQVGASPGAAAPRFAVQMATFRTKARAAESIRELTDAGYKAFTTEIGLRDGARAIGVFLGPYTERAAAAQELERAQLTPGYGVGRVVEIDREP